MNIDYKVTINYTGPYEYILTFFLVAPRYKKKYAQLTCTLDWPIQEQDVIDAKAYIKRQLEEKDKVKNLVVILNSINKLGV